MATYICSGDSMPAHVNVNGVWRGVREIWVRSGGQWRRTWDGFVQNGGSRNFHRARTEVTIAGAASTDIAGLFGGEWTANRRKQLTVTGATGPLFIGSDFGGELTIRVGSGMSISGFGGDRGVPGSTEGKPGGAALNTSFGDPSRLFLENYGEIRGGGGGGGRGGNGGPGAWQDTVFDGTRADATYIGGTGATIVFQDAVVDNTMISGSAGWCWGGNLMLITPLGVNEIEFGGARYWIGNQFHNDGSRGYYQISRSHKEWRYENGGGGGDGGYGAGWVQGRTNGNPGGTAHPSTGRGGNGGTGGDWGNNGGRGENGQAGNNGNGNSGHEGGIAGPGVRGWNRFTVINEGVIHGRRDNS